MSVPRFVGSIPALYDRHMGPVLFEPYARDLASRVPASARRVLEIAAGTGRVTRHLIAALPADGELVVTDLHEAMLDQARTQLRDPRVTWQAADAQALPFPDGTFDAIACQFGLMFVPDKPLALREMARVLAPGGTLLLSVWNALEHNPASQRLHEMAYALMVDDPPAFMATPFSMPDPEALVELARGGGFAQARVETVAKLGEATTAADLATGFVRGNPLWNQLVERRLDADAFEARVAEALAREFGDAPCRTPMSAHVLIATSRSR